MSEYTHNNGLVQRYGVDEAQKARVWTVSDGDRAGAQVVEINLEYSLLPSAGSSQIHTKFVNIPAGVQVEKAEVVVKTAFTSATSAATLTVTLVDESDYSSNPLAIETAETVANLTSLGLLAANGADIGSITAANKAVSVAVGGGEDFTAGEAVLRLYVNKPVSSTDTLGT